MLYRFQISAYSVSELLPEVTSALENVWKRRAADVRPAYGRPLTAAAVEVLPVK